MKLTQIIAGTLLSATLLTGVARASEWDVSSTHNTQPTQTAAEVLHAEDHSFTATYTGDKYKVSLRHQNNENGFGGDKEHTRVTLTHDANDWNLTWKLKDTSHQGDHKISGSLLASRDIGNTNLTLLGVVGENDFFISGAYLSTPRFDISAQDKIVSGDHSQSYAAGYHEGNNGIWLTRNFDGDYGMGNVVSTDEFSLYGFGKYRTDDTGFYAAQMVFGETDSKLFTAGIGRFTGWVLSDQLPRPEFRNLGSYLANGSVTAQLAYQNGDEEYVDVQVGGNVANIGSSTLSLGGGIKQNFTLDETFGVGEAHLSVPLGSQGALDDVTLGFMLKAEDTPDGVETMGGMTMQYKW